MSIIGPIQFRIGDQGVNKWKFAASHMKVCPICNDTNINFDRIVEGCRMNGDAYGTMVFNCANCKWITSFLWDDSSNDYYYEKAPTTRGGH